RLDELSFTANACLPNLPEPAANPLIFKGLLSSCRGSGAHYRALTFGVNRKLKYLPLNSKSLRLRDQLSRESPVSPLTWVMDSQSTLSI
ncbi:hypothetical protein V2S84_07575, partial [Azotobacter chroococcum]|nr:hypothetical protein [Azotobacter chroococcum]